MFHVNIVCELKLAVDNDNAKLILIWLASLSFSTRHEGVVLVKILVSSSDDDDVLSLDFFVVQVLVLGVLKNVLPIYFTVIKFICSVKVISTTELFFFIK